MELPLEILLIPLWSRLSVVPTLPQQRENCLGSYEGTGPNSVLGPNNSRV